MTTKAQAARVKQQRAANPPKPKKAKIRKRKGDVDTAEPGVSASDRKVGDGNTGSRNESKRSAKKGGAALEDSATGKPSRKSTRKSAGRAKRTTNLKLKTVRKASAPKTRARKAAAKKTTKKVVAAAKRPAKPRAR